MVNIGGREYLTPDEAAVVIGVTAAHVRWLLRAGRLEGWQDRRRRWVLAASARSYAAMEHGLVGDGARRRRKGKAS